MTNKSFMESNIMDKPVLLVGKITKTDRNEKCLFSV